MNEIYWITRLDAINNLSIAFIVVGVIISAILTILHRFAVSNGEGKAVKDIKPYRISSYIVLIIGVLMNTFIPNTKEATMIWCVGGTIDYIKSNDTATQLPDKCIQALDKFVDEYILNEENNKEK